MSELKNIHCNACGRIIEYPPEKEGSTSVCPDCGNQIWFSQLAEYHSHPNHPIKTTPAQGSRPPKGESPQWSLGVLVILLLMNMYLGYMVIGVKKEVIALKKRPDRTSERVLTSTNLVVPGAARQALSKANTNQELVDMLIETLELMDQDLQLQLSNIQNETNSQETKVAELTELSTQLNNSIDGLYDDISNIGNNLEQLSSSLTELQENQEIIQNSLIQN